MYLDELVEKYREALGGVPQWKAATELGVSPSYLSNAKKGHKPLADQWIVKMAEKTGVPAAEALAKYHMELAQEPSVKSAWADLAKFAAGIAPRAAGTAMALVIGLHCKSLILLQNWIFW